ncbi:hypothetical protein KFK14_01445 [Sphingobium phenoxybenzoativorans]|uniref:Uncharacterized protein n=1 Tax=Sphingobium phenoxybenzoativorans TaxID=1592790 RepID=A0A975KAY6_9SPHN|nr:hypothetical protein [Sphingobium phenoxybenzoativorans]QUT08040.1 hypothetical protein KFK14_01445 [Sphingobium phenoxybenzoativorans]
MPVAPAPPRNSRRVLVLILVGLAFLAGAALAVWAFPYVSRLWTPQVAAPEHVPVLGVAQRSATLAAARPMDATSQDLLDVRIRELEDRLTRITVEAQAASGNAARAEGLLVAVAARRSLDSGAPLGYVEGQLRLRFGQAQPRAVATIINAAREPVTLADLEAELDAIGPHLTGNPPDASWWTTFKNEARQMVIIRKSSTPSPLPDRAYRRAQRLLESGRVDAALVEVERLPAHDVADRWLQMARRYREARRALDLIETAAILEPRQIRTGDGAAVAQQSPLAP